MDSFRNFLLEFRVQHFAVAGPIQLLITTAAMWLVVNWIQKLPEKVPVWRCALCAVLLYAVSAGAIALMLFPAPLMLIAALIVWLAGSTAVTRVVLQLTEGGTGIFVMYLLVLVPIHAAIKFLMG